MAPCQHQHIASCSLTAPPCLFRKYHIMHYQPITNSKLLHHGVAYSCNPSKAAKVLNMTSMGPFDRIKTDMLCEQFYMVC